MTETLCVLNSFLKYIVKFLLVFAILYYGTFAFIGLAAPGGYYIPFFDHYLNYPAWLRTSLLMGSRELLILLGYHPFLQDKYVIKLPEGASVRMVYACLGYGIMSFWTAFVFANTGSWKRKLTWIAGGLVSIWFINVVRISILLVANSRSRNMPFGIDHHTWFNICAYILVFALMYLYDARFRSTRNSFNSVEKKSAGFSEP